MTPEQPVSVLVKVRQDLAKLPVTLRESSDALLVEHLAWMVDTDPSVAAVKELRVALTRLTGDRPATVTDPPPRWS